MLQYHEDSGYIATKDWIKKNCLALLGDSFIVPQEKYVLSKST